MALFGAIPPAVWRRAWQQLASDDPLMQASGLYFWIGVSCAAPLSDPDYCEKLLLARVALLIVARIADEKE